MFGTVLRVDALISGSHCPADTTVCVVRDTLLDIRTEYFRLIVSPISTDAERLLVGGFPIDLWDFKPTVFVTYDNSSIRLTSTERNGSLESGTAADYEQGENSGEK